MFPRTLRFALALSLLVCPPLLSARPPQEPTPGATPVQAAQATAAAAQAASVQAAGQARAAQAASRQAALAAARTPAGPLQDAARQNAAQAAAEATAAQTAATQAAQEAAAAQLAYRQALVQTAQQTAAARQATAQQAAAQAAAARLAAAQAAAKPAGAAAVVTPAATASVAKTSATSQAVAGGANNSTLGTVLTSIFSNGNTNTAPAGAAKGGGKANAATATATGTTPPAPSASSPPPSPAKPAVTQNNQSDGAMSASLGMAQFNDTILTVLGCGRQGTQVACVSDLSNQSKTETLVQSSAAWKDAFLIDDRGDRHERAIGFFLNVDGDKRVDMDIPYGKSAKYVFVFNDVPAKVAKVTLRSATGGLYVEDIPVTDAGSDQTASGAPAAAPASPAQGKPQSGKR